MNVIAQKIRKYRSDTRPAAFFAASTRVFWLTALLLFSVFGAVILDMYHRIALNSEMYSHLPIVVLMCEVMLLPAMLQIHYEGAQIRYRLHRPDARTVGFRVPELMILRDKVARINTIFKPEGSYEQLAKQLITAWEWRKQVAQEAEEAAMRRAVGFFSLPSASNLATYIAGVLAIVAAMTVTLIEKETFYRELPSSLNEAWSNIIILSLLIVLPVAACIIPTATIFVMLKSIVVWLRQRIDDDYLDRTSFYKFISELIQIEDNKERRLLMRTTGFVYWFVRIGTAHFSDIPKHFRNSRRGVRMGKIRKSRLNYSPVPSANEAS